LIPTLYRVSSDYPWGHVLEKSSSNLVKKSAPPFFSGTAMDAFKLGRAITRKGKKVAPYKKGDLY